VPKGLVERNPPLGAPRGPAFMRNGPNGNVVAGKAGYDGSWEGEGELGTYECNFLSSCLVFFFLIVLPLFRLATFSTSVCGRMLILA
jgi:hypothetical protein